MNFPFKLTFKPSAAVHTLFPREKVGDDGMIYLDQLVSIPADAVLYEVYALDKHELAGGVAQLIGSLQLDGNLIKSHWGDENLFFRHQRMDEDFKLHPEWNDYLPRFSLEGKCPYMKR